MERLFLKDFTKETLKWAGDNEMLKARLSDNYYILLRYGNNEKLDVCFNCEVAYLRNEPLVFACTKCTTSKKPDQFCGREYCRSSESCICMKCKNQRCPECMVKCNTCKMQICKDCSNSCAFCYAPETNYCRDWACRVGHLISNEYGWDSGTFVCSGCVSFMKKELLVEVKEFEEEQLQKKLKIDNNAE